MSYHFARIFHPQARTNGFKILTMLVTSALVLALLPSVAAPQTKVQAQTIDDEIVYIDGAGVIRVLDTNQAGTKLIQWFSDEDGFYDFALGDVNNDGDQEIIGIKGTGAAGKLVVYDPVVNSPAIPPDILPNIPLQ